MVTVGGRILGKGPMRTAHLRTVRMGLEHRLIWRDIGSRRLEGVNPLCDVMGTLMKSIKLDHR